MRLLVELSCSRSGSLALSSSRNDPLRENLAEFDAPLIEAVDLPDGALREDAVLVQRHQLAESGRRQAVQQECVRGRLPSNKRCGTSQSGVPSAFTSSGVLPNASASVWAKTLASSMS